MKAHAHRGNLVAAASSPAARLRLWVLKYGVLYGLTQAPMIALAVGFIFKWTTYPLATTFAVLPCLIMLPVWILHRRRVCSDPGDPSNRFPWLALWALFPVIAFDLARIPMHYAFRNVFWGTWFDFGSSLTGQPASHWTSLAAGTFLHIFQGYVLALGYYVLFRRTSLATALCYLFVMLSIVYSWLFPRYVILGPTPLKWYVVLWWAHLWFAVTAWACPSWTLRRYGNGCGGRSQPGSGNSRFRRGCGPLRFRVLARGNLAVPRTGRDRPRRLRAPGPAARRLGDLRSDRTW